MRTRFFLILAMLYLSGCVTVKSTPKPVLIAAVAAQSTQEELGMADRSYKHKIAIARFNNESNYGRALMSDAVYGQIGKQVSDMLASRLVRSGKFLVYERADIKEYQPVQLRADVTVREKLLEDEKTDKEIPEKRRGNAKPVQEPPTFTKLAKEYGVPGVDTLIIGSVTEFGRSVKGKKGFLSSKKVQTARARVEVRLIDVRSGHAYFSAAGTGEASTETGEVAGFGSRASYDATLNDRALGAAVSDMISDLISHLEQRPWQCAVLKIEGDQVYISGGNHQGIKIGEKLQVKTYGEKVVHRETAREIQLPGKNVAEVEVVSLFGSDEFSEGAVCKITTGSCAAGTTSDYFVCELN